MNFYRYCLTAVVLLCCTSTASAQRWVETWTQNQGNFYAIQSAYNLERQQELEKQLSFFRRFRLKGKKEAEEKEGAWLHYKRWEWLMEPRVYPSGDLSLPSTTYDRFNEYLQQNPDARLQAGGARTSQPANWTFVGPTGAPSGGGAGRINGVRVDPVNTDIIWACAPAGGLWKTTDGGATWSNNNDFLSMIGCTDVLIDPNNTQIMYLATGDADAGDTYSIGVLKSTDGGISWNPTTLTWPVSLYRRIYKMIMDPNNTSVIYAATNAGIFKTDDAGITWTRVYSALTYDIEFQPGNPNRIYSCGTKFARSDDAGLSWIQVSSGLPTSIQVTRLAIGVTAANPNYVYVLAGAATSYAYQGMYRSTDNANTFVQMSNSPNLMGWNTNGNDNGGQAWYTLSIAVSQTDPNEVITGGVNIWKSVDGGQSWDLNAHWYGGGGAPYVHADIHDLQYGAGSGSVIYSGNDGGVFSSNDNGVTWNDISGNMGIAQIYRIGLSASNSSMLITGHQDNGTNLKNGSNYEEVLGGDGMDCFIDWSDDNVMYGELYYGDFHRSTNGGNNWQTITNGLPNSGGAWITPWSQDPVDPNTIYAGYSQVYKSTDQGNNWFQLGNVTTSGSLNWLKVAPSNTQVIYASAAVSISKTTDGGQNWTSITAGLPTSLGQITRFDVSSLDENKVWVTFSGYSATAKVYFTANGGQTWSNWSSGLPNLPVNCVVAVPGTSSDAVFVGCDVGVYYRDNNSNGWQPYFTGLPNTIVDDLEIFAPTMTLRAATYGRGVWECPIDTTILAPGANFSANVTAACPGQTISFTDLSTSNITSWNWSFPGATPASSTAQNPSVVYNTPGVYPVTLAASNANGTGTETKTTYIMIGGYNVLPMTEGFTLPDFMPAAWTAVNNSPNYVFWERNDTVGYNSTESAYFDNYHNSVNGATDDLRTPMYNFSGYSSLSLSFDVAYCRYNSLRSDTLEVLVSTDCGQTATPVYLKGGTVLSTKPDQVSPFIPTNSQWRTETVSLNSFAGNSSVMLAFRNHGRHGQYLYLDNIQITGTPVAAPVAGFMYSPVNICAGAPVNFFSTSAPAPDSWTWTFNGADTLTSADMNPFPRTWNTPGTYSVSLIVSNVNGADTITQTINVLPNPVANAGSDTSLCRGAYVELLASGGGTYSWAPATGVSNPTIANPAITFTVSGTATVTVTDSNGCTGSDAVAVTIHPVPVFSISAPVNICPGDTVLMTCSNSTYSYTWDALPSIFPLIGDSVWVFPQVSTPYTVTATNSNGCTTTATRSVSAFPLPGAPTISANGNVLTSSATTGNQWYLNGVAIPGETNQTYTITQPGIYSVVVTNGSGCSSQASLAFIVSTPESTPDFGIRLVPNPSDGHFTLDLDLPQSGEYTIEIRNVLGQLVFSEMLGTVSGAVRKSIDLSASGKGTYFIRVFNAENEVIRKVLVH